MVGKGIDLLIDRNERQQQILTDFSVVYKYCFFYNNNQFSKLNLQEEYLEIDFKYILKFIAFQGQTYFNVETKVSNIFPLTQNLIFCFWLFLLSISIFFQMSWIWTGQKVQGMPRVSISSIIIKYNYIYSSSIVFSNSKSIFKTLT